MARIKDWIPVGQEAFADWSQQFVHAVDELAAALELPEALIGALKAAQAAFMEAWAVRQKEDQSLARSAAKKALITAHRAYLRGWFNRHIRHNPALNDEIRARLGVPIPNRTKSRIKVGNHQVAFDLYPRGVFVVGMQCQDVATGERHMRYGMSGILVRFGVADKPLSAMEELTEAALITRMRHRFHLGNAQRGKWLSVSCAWVSTTGEQGSFSPIQSAVVP
jgi:hypothetical protein